MKKKDIKILEDINKKAAAIYGDKLWTTQPKADVMLDVAKKALTTDRKLFSKEDLIKLQSIVDSGMLEGEEKVVNEDVAKAYDKYIGDEITLAIKEGRLSHPDKDPFIKKLKQKQRKDEKRNK